MTFVTQYVPVAPANCCKMCLSGSVHRMDVCTDQNMCSGEFSTAPPSQETMVAGVPGLQTFAHALYRQHLVARADGMQCDLLAEQGVACASWGSASAWAAGGARTAALGLRAPATRCSALES